jgi:hypothetical protein
MFLTTCVNREEGEKCDSSFLYLVALLSATKDPCGCYFEGMKSVVTFVSEEIALHRHNFHCALHKRLPESINRNF